MISSMNIKESKKLQFLQEWRQDHLTQMHWMALTLREAIIGERNWSEESVKIAENYIRWCGQRAFELKADIDKLDRA